MASDDVAGLDDDMGGDLTLTSNDGQSFKVEKKSAYISKLVKESLEESGLPTSHICAT